MHRTILINGGLFETRLALLEEDRLAEIIHLPFGAADGFCPAPAPLPGALYLARISRIAPELDAAFADIGAGPHGFLPAAACPPAKTAAGGGISRQVQEGQWLPVMVMKAAYDDKGPRLGARLAPEYEALAKQALNALDAKQRKPGPLPGAQPELAAAITRLAGTNADGLDSILADHPAAFALLQTRLDPALGGRLERAPAADLFTEHGIEEQISAALEPVYPLPGGGTLIIEPTSALTAIDVNSGGMGGAELRYRLNLEAARQIPRQLRLRGIGGQVVIDFLPVRPRKQSEDVLAALQAACAPDAAQIKISRLTPGGLVALTRERRGPSLATVLLQPAPAPAHGPPGAAAAANALMRSLGHAARQPGSRNFTALVSQDITDWLAQRPDFQLAAQREFGLNLTLKTDAGLGSGQWTIERAA